MKTKIKTPAPAAIETPAADTAVATAAQDPQKVTAADTPQTPDEPKLYTPSEVEQIRTEAYLRGKNEAIEAKIQADTAIPLGINPATPDFIPTFATRHSVWPDL